MLIDHCHRVFYNLLGGLIGIAIAVCIGAPVSMVLQLRQVMAQLVKKALAKVAAADSRRIELANNLDRLMQIFPRESGRSGCVTLDRRRERGLFSLRLRNLSLSSHLIDDGGGLLRSVFQQSVRISIFLRVCR